MHQSLQLALSILRYHLFRQRKHLIVFVTNHCNFRCQHCFVRFQPRRELDLDRFKRLAREAGRLFWLDIGGGEPFLRPDLNRIVNAFDAQIIHIPSNGFLTERIMEQVQQISTGSARELVIGLSLDGLQATHDKIRGQNGSYEKVWETFERLRALQKVSIKITTVLTQQNEAEIIPLMHEVKRQGVDFHSVILLRGDPLNPQLKLPAMTRLRQLEPEIFKILNSYTYGQSILTASILKNYHRYLWDLSLSILEHKKQMIPCLAGQTQLVVYADGSVSACELLKPVGSIQGKSLNQVTRSKAFGQQLDHIRNQACHCTHNCALLDSIFFNPRLYPKLIIPKAVP